MHDSSRQGSQDPRRGVGVHASRIPAILEATSPGEPRMTATDHEAPTESIDDFTARVQSWAAEHLTRAGAAGDADGADKVGEWMREHDLDPSNLVARGRAILKVAADAGFGGLAFPEEYGGQGLPLSYVRAFNAAVQGYDFAPLAQFTLTLGMNAPALMEFGSEDQKRRYLPRMFDGTDLWIQFLSEPTGGSDLASAITRADRDGDEWVVNGSKIWTSSADKADMGMCLVRTNWDVPKHRGMSVLIIPMDAPGLEINPLRLVSGQTGFCQEFFTDVRVPTDALLGELHDGWNVASRLLVHERNVLNGGSEYYLPPGGGFAAMMASAGSRRDDLLDLADARGANKDPHVRQLVAEAYLNGKVAMQTGPRVTAAMQKGLVPPAASSILKLLNSENSIRRSDITMTIAGTPAVAWETDDLRSEMRGLGYLSRQTASLVSGTSEIPREPSPDREMPFSQVRHNTMPTSRGGQPDAG
jgi:alkylation response protein AidB-like acyl-CoA dehydrogenase